MKLTIVVNDWQYHIPSEKQESKIDFKKLNKLILKNGGATSARAKI